MNKAMFEKASNGIRLALYAGGARISTEQNSNLNVEISYIATARIDESVT